MNLPLGVTDMSRCVLAYHGTSKRIRARVLRGDQLLPSVSTNEWLGQGVYFWEHNADRALDWARKRHGENAAVVAALIDLDGCFDLLDRRYVRNLENAAGVFDQFIRDAGVEMPKNGEGSRGARRYDCAVIELLMSQHQRAGRPFASVRGAFEEGERLHGGRMALRMDTHIQIAVRDPRVIKALIVPYGRADLDIAS